MWFNRRLRGDQIEDFKILNGYKDIDRNTFLRHKKVVETADRTELAKEQCTLDIRKQSFSHQLKE